MQDAWQRCRAVIVYFVCFEAVFARMYGIDFSYRDGFRPWVIIFYISCIPFKTERGARICIRLRRETVRLRRLICPRSARQSARHLRRKRRSIIRTLSICWHWRWRRTLNQRSRRDLYLWRISRTAWNPCSSGQVTQMWLRDTFYIESRGRRSGIWILPCWITRIL